MVTRAQIDRANPQVVLGMVDSWKRSAKDMLSHADTYRQAVTLPGGQPWSGQTRDAAVAMAGQDHAAIEAVSEAIDAMANAAANGVTFSVMPSLNEVRAKIAAALSKGFEVNDDLSVTDLEQDDDDDDAPDPRRVQEGETFEREIQAGAQKWWDADQAVATQIGKDQREVAAKFSHGHVSETGGNYDDRCKG